VIILGFEHVHVSEREVAHQSPCGFDPGGYEDCLWCSFLEWWRATGHPDSPATHAEAEALRCDAGEPPTGPSDFNDVRRGVTARYGATLPAVIAGDDAIWAALGPGNVATVIGSMAVFSDGSHWRRWDASFKGIHAVSAWRLDTSDRVWWCDPLAPTRLGPTPGTSWNGEWMPRADFLAFATSAIIGPVIGADMLQLKGVGPKLGTFVIGAGHSIIAPIGPPMTHYPRLAGETFDVLAQGRLTGLNGQPMDVDGRQPPVDGRDEVFLVDNASLGVACFALPRDGTFTMGSG